MRSRTAACSLSLNPHVDRWLGQVYSEEQHGLLQECLGYASGEKREAQQSAWGLMLFKEGVEPMEDTAWEFGILTDASLQR